MYFLIDAEERHALDPETFEIPPADVRMRVPADAFCKLLFELAGEGEVERMWVKVIDGPDEAGLYIGELANHPVVIPDLKMGDEVMFYPFHICAVVVP